MSSDILLLGTQNETHWIKLKKYVDDVVDNSKSADMTQHNVTQTLFWALWTHLFPSKDSNKFI